MLLFHDGRRSDRPPVSKRLPVFSGQFYFFPCGERGDGLMPRKLFVTVVVATALLFGCTNKGAQSDSTAPDFTLQDMVGKSVKLSDYKGKVVLLEFWATWCPPCRASVPGLEKLHEAYKDKGLAVLAVSMDEGGWDVVKTFMTEQGITYSVLKVNEDVAVK